MRLVPAKWVKPQMAVPVQGARDVLVKHRVETAKAILARLSQFGIATPKACPRHVGKSLYVVDRCYGRGMTPPSWLDLHWTCQPVSCAIWRLGSKR